MFTDLVQISDQNTVNQYPRNSPTRFDTRSVRRDDCIVDCYTYWNKAEIQTSAITTVAVPTTTTTTNIKPFTAMTSFENDQ